MRRETPENQQQCSTCCGTGTRGEVPGSRYELERVLNKYGADEVLFVEADANASIQFAMHGRFVQLALPLPDPEDARFTHTPTGKPRALSAQERAYDQALREHWRSLIVAVRGKLQSVESGISTFEQEFDRFLVPHFADEKRRSRKAPKAVNWLLGGSHSLAIALVAAFLVPASAVGAFALPTNVVGHLSAPFRSAVADASAAGGQDGNGLELASGGWSPSAAGTLSAAGDRLFAARSQTSAGVDSQVRQEAALMSPPSDTFDPPAAQPVLASLNASPISSGGDSSPASPPPQPAGGDQQPASGAEQTQAPAPPPSDTPASRPPSSDG